MGAHGEEQEPRAPAGDPRKASLGPLSAKPLGEADKYYLFVIQK